MKQQHHSSSYHNSQSLLRQQRNLEMVMSGRHKFEVRDLEDSLREETVVVPLALPKLPSAFDSATSSGAAQTVPNGLIRSPWSQADSESVHNESIEEEKLLIDSKSTEKNRVITSQREKEEEAELQQVLDNAKTTDSITMKSINTSWSIAGESMMHESQMSQLSSKRAQSTCNNVTELYSEEATLNAPSIAADCSFQENRTMEDTDNEVTLNDVHLDFNEDDRTTADEAPFESELEKYANNHNEPMLEDETSPSVSLLTSSNSKETGVEKKELDEEEEDNDEEEDRLEDTTEPDIKSPTHTSSHSNSISDPGRDFLIDDEIADQPGLFSNYNNGKSTKPLSLQSHFYIFS